MKSIKTLLFASLGFLAMTSANATQYNCDPQPACPPEPPCCDIPGGPTTSAYNHPDGIDVCGTWDLYITGTFLWIQPRQEQMSIGSNPYFTAPTALYSKAIDFDFKWKPALKVGLGYNFDYDNWDSYLQYTRINTSMNNKEILGNDPGATLATAWLAQVSAGSPPLPAGFTQREATLKWRLDHNIFDLELGRSYYNGKSLTFKAHYGLRGGWIDQVLNATVTDTILDVSLFGDFKSDSWLVGPRAGFYTKWLFEKGFRFFGNGAMSIFYQKFYKVSYQEPSVNNPSEWYQSLNFPQSTINASIELLLGLGWGRYFYRNNWHLDFALGYEAQLFFNQNYIRVDQQAFTNNYVKAGNLMFHGLNATLRLDF